MLATLPATYEEAPRMYDAFLDTFGTHFYQSGKFGGYLNQKTFISNSYLYASTEHSLQANLKANYLRLVKGSIGVDVNATSISNAFMMNTEIHHRYYGGHRGPRSAPETVNLHEWERAVLQDPWLVGGQLVPIESLIQNETLQREVKKAVLVKLTRATLGDIRESLHLGRITLPAEELSLLHEIEEYFKYEEYLDNAKESAFEVAMFNGNIEKLFTTVKAIRGKGSILCMKAKLTCFLSLSLTRSSLTTRIQE